MDINVISLASLNRSVSRKLFLFFLADILEIHRRVIGYTDPSEAGMFRRTQVFVGDHIPPAAGHIDQLMRRFLLWLNSNEAMVMHPVRLAALAHYKLVYIHPFVDGNGRTSRLLMNLILMQVSCVPPEFVCLMND